MDKRISPQDLAVLDRRQVLRGAAAATAIRALPASERAVAAPQEIEASANLVAWSHFSAATLRRLEEIALRNRLRKEAGLPLLSVVKELRRMKTVEDGGVSTSLWRFTKRRFGTRSSNPFATAWAIRIGAQTRSQAWEFKRTCWQFSGDAINALNGTNVY